MDWKANGFLFFTFLWELFGGDVMDVLFEGGESNVDFITPLDIICENPLDYN